MVKNAAWTAMDVLLKQQEKIEKIYTKKDLVTVQTVFFFEKLSCDWHWQKCLKYVEFLGDTMGWKMLKAKIAKIFEKRKEKKGKE